jgi:hypothetical protein
MPLSFTAEAPDAGSVCDDMAGKHKHTGVVRVPSSGVPELGLGRSPAFERWLSARLTAELAPRSRREHEERDAAGREPHYASCVATEPKCGPFLDCMTDSDCWAEVDPGATVIPSCASVCMESVGAGSFNELLPAIALLVCASDDRCGRACKGTGSSGSDAGTDAAASD